MLLQLSIRWRAYGIILIGGIHMNNLKMKVKQFNQLYNFIASGWHDLADINHFEELAEEINMIVEMTLHFPLPQEEATYLLEVQRQVQDLLLNFYNGGNIECINSPLAC
jgi:hypothetical protein